MIQDCPFIFVLWRRLCPSSTDNKGTYKDGMDTIVAVGMAVEGQSDGILIVRAIFYKKS